MPARRRVEDRFLGPVPQQPCLEERHRGVQLVPEVAGGELVDAIAQRPHRLEPGPQLPMVLLKEPGIEERVVVMPRASPVRNDLDRGERPWCRRVPALRMAAMEPSERSDAMTATKPTMSVKDAAATFLQCRRIAVTGVSRTPQDHGANASTSGCAIGGTRCSR